MVIASPVFCQESSGRLNMTPQEFNTCIRHTWFHAMNAGKMELPKNWACYFLLILICVDVLATPCLAQDTKTKSNSSTSKDKISAGATLHSSFAEMHIAYNDKETGDRIELISGEGRYGLNSEIKSESGWIIHTRTEEGENHGCSPPTNVDFDQHQGQNWVALVERGHCRFFDKILNSAFFHNASAVVVYNNLDEDELTTMQNIPGGVVALFISREQGQYLASLVDEGTPVWLNISVSEVTIYKVLSEAQMAKEGYRPEVSNTTMYICLAMLAAVVTGLGALIGCGLRKAQGEREKKKKRKPSPNKKRVRFLLQPTTIEQVEQGLLASDIGKESPDLKCVKCIETRTGVKCI